MPEFLFFPPSTSLQFVEDASCQTALPYPLAPSSILKKQQDLNFASTRRRLPGAPGRAVAPRLGCQPCSPSMGAEPEGSSENARE